MLIGSYPMTVDAKARVTLPSSFRSELVSEDCKSIVLVPYRGNVNGFTPEGFKAWVDSLFGGNGRNFDSRNQNDARLKWGLLSSATKVDVDSAGRVALGKLDVAFPGSREKMGLTGDVMVVGEDDHFEVWNAEKWAAEHESFRTDLDSLLFG